MKQVFLCAAMLLVILASCSPVPPDFAKKQSITYLRTDITNMSTDKIDANVVFQEINRDSVSLDNVSANFDLFLEKQKVASGKDIKFNFKANDTTEFVIPVEAKYLDLFKTTENLAKAEINGKKTVKYEVIAVVTLYYNLASFSITVSAEGDWPLPDVKKPKIKF
jgi:hypothetical protein